MKPRVFIASSVEGLDIAWAIQENLRHVAECTVWTQGVFELNESNIETLLKSLDRFEYGVFVFNSDDVAKIRQKTVNVTRDNVIFELGLFYGSHGKQRNFIIAPQGVNLHIPTDLLGIAPATFDPSHSDGNLTAALGPACTQITRAINKSSEFGHLSESVEIEQVSREWSNSFINVPKSRKDSIRGKWEGEVIPRNSSKLRAPLGKLKPQNVDMSFALKPGMKLITATSTFQSPITERGLILNDELFPKAVDGHDISSGLSFSVDVRDAVDQVL
jgi:hypothetical protein